MLTQIEGMPKKGMILLLAGRKVSLLEVGKNTTDGKPVSTRSCLTGKPVSAYGSVFIEWESPYPDRSELYQEWVEEMTKE